MFFFWNTHVFIQLNWVGLFGKKVLFYPLKTLIHRQYSFQKPTWFTQRNNMLHVPASNIDAFLSQIHVFLQVCWMGFFGPKCPFLSLENPNWKAVFLSKTNSILTEKQCARCSTFKRLWFFLTATCAFLIQLNRRSWTNELSSPLKILIGMQYYFQK
jgi:hypothetical protein